MFPTVVEKIVDRSVAEVVVLVVETVVAGFVPDVVFVEVDIVVLTLIMK